MEDVVAITHSNSAAPTIDSKLVESLPLVSTEVPVKVYLQDDALEITSEYIKKGENTYAFLDITATTLKKDRKGQTTLILGVLLLGGGILFQSGQMLLGGGLLAFIGFMLGLISKLDYVVALTTSKGEVPLIVLKDQQRAEAIFAVIQQAFTDTQPNRDQAKQQLLTVQPSQPADPAVIKCKRCGSTQISANQKGFSGGKAVAGAVLLGPLGLLGGTLGSKKVKITCLNCGNQWEPGRG